MTRLTVDLHKLASSGEGFDRMVMAGSVIVAMRSDMIRGLRSGALSQVAQVLERVDSRGVSVVPGDPDCIIADAAHRPGGNVFADGIGIEHLATAHLLDAHRTRAGEAQISHVDVIAAAVLPQHR